MGFVTGLGYFTFPSWPIVALSVILILLLDTSPVGPAKNKKIIFLFLCSFFLALIPFLCAIWFAGYGEHISAMSRFNHWFSRKDQWTATVSYFSDLFWGPWESFSWQGDLLVKLNPLLGAAFFWGCVQLYRYRSRGIVVWIGVVFLIYFIPGILSGNFEPFRIVQVFPFLILITALGIGGLIAESAQNRRMVLLLGLLLVSIGMDGYRLASAQADPLSSPEEVARSSYPIESIRSYRIVKDISDRVGPGFIFTEFMQVPRDTCLFVMTYPFNAAENPHLNFQSVQWAAVVVNEHYYSFLSKRFPEARWYGIHEGRERGSETVLGIIPISPTNRQTLSAWAEAHHYFRRLSLVLDGISENKTYQIADRVLKEPPAIVAADRFLESCYWERRAQFYYDYHFETHYEDQVDALRQALVLGYPAAHLYYDLGCLLARKGHLEEALSDFKTALRIEPDYLNVINAMNYFNPIKTRL